MGVAWRSLDGAAWEPASEAGFGNPNNAGPYSANAVVSLSNRLIVGAVNPVDGPQLWIYLP